MILNSWAEQFVYFGFGFISPSKSKPCCGWDMQLGRSMTFLIHFRFTQSGRPHIICSSTYHLLPIAETAFLTISAWLIFHMALLISNFPNAWLIIAGIETLNGKKTRNVYWFKKRCFFSIN